MAKTTGMGWRIKRNRQHPEPYLLACEKLGLNTSEVLAVEDSVVGVESAKSANIFTVGFIPLNQNACTLRNSDIVIHNIASLLEIATRHK